MKKYQFRDDVDLLSYRDVRIEGGFWEKRQTIIATKTLDAQLEQLKKTGRLSTFKKTSASSDTTEFVFDTDVKSPRKHHYWDSDVAKWIEATAYSLSKNHNNYFENVIDGLVDDMEKMQLPDGYLNSYFINNQPDKRFTNLYVMHELYCAGHMIEAAIAYFQASGKRKYLEIVIKYIDHIIQKIGPGENQINGYPGHQEIELALVKLARITNDKKYLDLSLYFINARGQSPLFFDKEALLRHEDPDTSPIKPMLDKGHLEAGPYALFQSHKPVREQNTAEGHSVRVMYQCCAMADLAYETKDSTLFNACKRIWQNVTKKRMYITGGVSPKDIDERFCHDYYLPNKSAYNETCATIGLFMWAFRMLRNEQNRVYSDIMEKALFNGILSGISLDGEDFFYANHLAVEKGIFSNRIERNARMFPWRQKWFPVSCCPPNISRLISSLGGYIYTYNDQSINMHLYLKNDSEFQINKHKVDITVVTDYPIEDLVKIHINPKKKVQFDLNLRIPDWCNIFTVKINNELQDFKLSDTGYISICRQWSPGDIVELYLNMEVIEYESHPSVAENSGKVCLCYGPLVYCLEEIDNGDTLFDINLGENPDYKVHFEPDLLDGINVINAKGYIRNIDLWDDALYKPKEIDSHFNEINIIAVPYYAWANRDKGDMNVWINKIHNSKDIK